VKNNPVGAGKVPPGFSRADFGALWGHQGPLFSILIPYASVAPADQAAEEGFGTAFAEVTAG